MWAAAEVVRRTEPASGMKPAGATLGGFLVVLVVVIVALQPADTDGSRSSTAGPAAQIPSAVPSPVPSPSAVPSTVPGTRPAAGAVAIDSSTASVAAYSTLVLCGVALCLAAFIVARDAGRRRGESWN